MKPEKKFDAVLPLILKDFERFKILDRSIRKNLKDLNVCWLVTTAKEYDAIKNAVDKDYYRVISESSIIPELEFYKKIGKLLWDNSTLRRYAAKKGRCNVSGWYIQQLVKLAIADKIETDFYLTLDADIVCIRPVGYDDLIPYGKAITNTEIKDHHASWYESAMRILKMPRSGIVHGVTPAIISRTAVLDMQKHIGKNAHSLFKFISFFFPHNSSIYNIAGSWRSHLIRATPWTEYTLYFTYLEATKQFDKYHIYKGSDAIYNDSSSIWVAEQINDFNMNDLFNSDSYFLVFQSNTNILTEDVLKKIGVYI